MKAYSNGLLHFVATVAALLANGQLRENFDRECPILFYGEQLLLGSVFIVLTIHIFIKWEHHDGYSKWNLFRSVIACIILYCIAYIESGYSFLFILIVGSLNAHSVRKRFNEYSI